MIKAVLLDVDNTLLDFNKCATKAMGMAFKEYSLPFKESDFLTFKRINDGLWLDIEKKKITREYLHANRFNIILKELGIDFDGHKIEKSFLLDLNVCTEFVDGALDLVKYLSEKYVLCSASNAPYNQQIARLNNSGLNKYLKKTFISEKMGVNKPDKKFFDKCFEELAPITKEQTVMIGDSLTADINGAKEYGLKCIWFNFDKKKTRGDEADFIVNKLEEIKEIL